MKQLNPAWIIMWKLTLADAEQDFPQYLLSTYHQNFAVNSTSFLSIISKTLLYIIKIIIPDNSEHTGKL